MRTIRFICKYSPLCYVCEVQCGVEDGVLWRCSVVLVVLEDSGSLCRGDADGAGAYQPAWAVGALRTAPFRHCKEFEECNQQLICDMNFKSNG